LAFIVTEPLAHPVPDHPAKVDPAAGVAVKVTTVPLLKAAEQVLPQLMAAGELVTVPLPVPERPTVSVKVTAGVVAQFSPE
jgi:hypothetical protein